MKAEFKNKIGAFVLITTLFWSEAHAQPFGQVDSTFHAAITNKSRINSLAAQSDGKLVLGGGLIITGQTTPAPVVRLLPDGDPDTTFNLETTGLSTGTRITLQPDGKILVWDNGATVDGTKRAVLLRLNADGSTDNSFQLLSEPTVTLPASEPAYPVFNQVVPQADGRIMVSGYFRMLSGVTRWHLARLNANGTIDSSFDPGTVLTNIISGIWLESKGFIRSIAVQPDNKVLVGGINFYDTKTLLLRFNANGSVDTNFNVAFHFGYNDGPSRINEVTALPDGKILVNGKFPLVNGEEAVSLVRLESSGQLDHSFVSPLQASVRSLADAGGFSPYKSVPETWASFLRADGKYLVSGAELYSVEMNGERDNTFNAGASVTTFPLFPRSPLPDVAGTIQDNRALVFADTTNSLKRIIFANPPPRLSVITQQPESQNILTNQSVQLDVHQASSSAVTYQWQFNGQNLPNQTNRTLSLTNTSLLQGGAYRVVISNSFGSVVSAPAMVGLEGRQADGISASYNTSGKVAALLALPDGGFVAGGSFTTFNGVSCNGLVKVNAGGTVDETFILNAAAFIRSVTALATGDDGTLLVGAWIKSEGAADELAVARILVDGRKDETFQIGEGATGNTNRVIHSIAVQTDGKVIVGGYFHAYNGIARSGLVRLNSSGNVELAPFAPQPVALVKAMFGYDNTTNAITGIGIQPNGKVIVTGGFATFPPTTGIYQGVARLDSSGSVDPTFQANFVYDHVYNNSNVQIHSLELLPDGKVLVAGEWVRAGVEDVDYPFALARLLPDGNPDPMFHPAKDVHVQVGVPFIASRLPGDLMTLAVEPDGGILFSADFDTTLAKVVRLKADGSLDEEINIPGEQSKVANDIASLSDGRAVIAFDDAVKVLAPRVPLLRLKNPATAGGAFTADVQTIPGHTYRLEAASSVTGPNWQAGPASEGDGTIKTLNAPLGSPASFYRLRVE